jgi:hypothetical protein
MSDNHLQPNDLAWDAFRYAAGEMDAAEAAQFEERLAVEQPAREALAAAIELAQVSCLAMSGTGILPVPSTSMPSPKRKRNWLWPALGAAACLAAVACVAALGVGDWNAHRELARSQAKQNELAARWSEVRELAAADLTESESDDPLEALAEIDMADADQPADEDAAADDQLALAPDWMLAAVVGLRNEEMMDDEQRVDPPQDQ